MARIDTLPPLKEVIATHNLAAKKSLGQNFLLDLNLTAKIARIPGDLSQAPVLEVGPGPGGLTRGLLAEGARHVTVVEKDPRCRPALDQIAAHYPDRLTIREGDALTLAPVDTLPEGTRIVANLPYNVGTELLTRWLTPKDWPPRWHSLTLMFQREVADRIVAAPGSKAYGRLAILVQWRCETRIAMSLPPEAFQPAPKVHSAVVHITALPDPWFPANAAKLSELTRRGFGQRRKMLRASLKGLANEATLERAGIPPTARAEEIPLERWCALSLII